MTDHAAIRTPTSGRGREAQESIAIPNAPHLKALVDAPMSRYTTWRIGGPADFLVRASVPDDVVAAFAWAHHQGIPIHVIGGGSNLLVSDKGIRGLVIVSRTPGERAEHLVHAEDQGDAVLVRVAAQAPLSWVGRYCSERGWAGMEWGVGLPGMIGGATVNNAGAHGTEQKDHLDSVAVLDREGSVESHDLAWLETRYRHTRLKDTPQPRNAAVVEVVLRLPKGDPEHLRQLADDHAEYRHATQPTGRCAGSTFTNPPGGFAGRLLEAAGLKDFAVGGVRFSTIHSNFIVNDGTATAEQVRQLIAIAQERVLAEFGVELMPEIEEIGER
jgi:UDP-N-acetylmuramate dehydrogenase